MKKGMYSYTINYCRVSSVWGIFETKDKKRDFPIYSHKDLSVIKPLYQSLAFGKEIELEGER